MNREELVLACLAPAKGALHSPVQVQKMFFLIDKNIPEDVEGPHFDFHPYDYGPFDKAVYETLEELTQKGLVSMCPERTWMSYRLTSAGQEAGEATLSTFSDRAQGFIIEVSDFVRRLSFTQLVSAIYNFYPEMRANSVFQG
jgi:uncharacterized protein